MIVAILNGEITPVLPRKQGQFKGLATVYENREDAIADWDGWGFMADVIEVEIRPITKPRRRVR